MIRILPSGWGTATSESLSVLAWIWLMALISPQRDGGYKLLETFWRRTVNLVLAALPDGSSRLNWSFTNKDSEGPALLHDDAAAVDGLVCW